MRADAKKNYDHLLAVARDVIGEEGADASLRDIARKAGVGLGTLYRHFPTRDALLEALLRTSFDEIAVQARQLQGSSSAEEALMSWLRDFVMFAHKYRGVTAAMMTAIEAPESALHASCVAMKASGAELLQRAQAEGVARKDIDGADLYALAAALSWLGDQPLHAPRVEHLFNVISSAILTAR